MKPEKPVHFVEWKKISDADFISTVRKLAEWGVRDIVEPRGVEPLSCDVIMTISTCLFCLYCFSSSGFADRQAAFRLAHLKSRTRTDE